MRACHILGALNTSECLRHRVSTLLVLQRRWQWQLEVQDNPRATLHTSNANWHVHSRKGKSSEHSGWRQGGFFLDGVWQQRRTGTAQGPECNSKPPHVAFNCKMSIARPSLTPFAGVCFPEKLFRDLCLLEANWRGHGFGT